LDEAFVKVNGKLCYLWRAVDHEGEVLDAVVTSKRDKAAALKLLKRIMKKYGRPRKIVTYGLCSYPAAMREIGNADRQEVGRHVNNRAENPHQPFRRREPAMQRFRSLKTLQKFSSVYVPVHNHFSLCARASRYPLPIGSSIRNAISSREASTSGDARPHWRSGAPFRRKSSLPIAIPRHAKTNRRYFDNAVGRPHNTTNRTRQTLSYFKAPIVLMGMQFSQRSRPSSLQSLDRQV